MRRHQASTAAIAVALAVLGSLVLSAAPAAARFAHHFGSTFTGSGTNALSAPTGIAVDNSNGPSAGDVYVTDPTNKRVEKFDAAGNFILMFGKNVNLTTPGDVCPINSGDVCQPGTSGTGPGQFSNPLYVAVDNSSGPSAGDVYVAGDGIVQKFDPGGDLITSWGGSPAPGQLNKPPGSDPCYSSFSTIFGFAVAPDGGLLVGAAGNCGTTHLTRFNQAANQVIEITARPIGTRGIAIDPSGFLYVSQSSGYTKMSSEGVELGQVNSTGTRQGIAVEPSTGDFFVTNGALVNSYHFTGGTEVQTPTSSCSFAGAKAGGTGCPPTETFGSAGNLTDVSGLAVSAASGAVYATNPANGKVVVFTRYILPDLFSAPATNLTTTSATINETVDPAGGSPVSDCHFEYGTGAGSYGLGSGPCSSTAFSEPTLVSANLSGLELLVPYHYRFVVTTADGTAYGFDETVRSVPDLPKVNSTVVSMVHQDSAMVKADIDPGEGLTTFRFDYGVTTAYESHTVAGGPIDPEGSDHTASGELSDLEPGVTYHFRVSASNYTGTTFGPDVVFTTPSAPVADSGGASSVGRTSATLNALVNPGFSLTTYHFEYGPTPSYGTSTPESTAIGPDKVAHAVSATVPSLAAGTTYHFRVVAINGIGTSYGTDRTFTTEPPEAERPKEVEKKCKKGFVRKHGKCVRKRRKHHRRHHRHTDGRHG